MTLSIFTPWALVTGGGRRGGEAFVRALHARGLSVLIHVSRSVAEGEALAAELNAHRADSARCVVADLANPTAVETITQAVADAVGTTGQLQVLVHNASSFYPTPVGQATAAQWEDLFASNARAPFFLTQALAPMLRASGRGAIVTLVDIHARYPLAEHPIYSMAKAALVAMTRALARDLAPAIRVNGVAPGAVVWPEGEGAMPAEQQAEILASIPLGRLGGFEALVDAVVFLALDARYVSGQILAVDGGRSVWG